MRGILNHRHRRADITPMHRVVSPTGLRTLVVALVLGLLAIPSAALAGDCSYPIRKIGPVDIGAKDIRTPLQGRGSAKDWKLDASWTSVQPLMSQYVQIKNGRRFHGSSFSAQRALSIDAYAPEDLNWLYVEDADPSTPPCTMLGRSAWQAPQIFVRETKFRVFVAAASKPAAGDHRGCVLGPDWGVRPCPLLTRRIMKLKAPVGNRKIVFHFWGPNPEDPMTPIAPYPTQATVTL